MGDRWLSCWGFALSGFTRSQNNFELWSDGFEGSAVAVLCFLCYLSAPKNFELFLPVVGNYFKFCVLVAELVAGGLQRIFLGSNDPTIIILISGYSDSF